MNLSYTSAFSSSTWCRATLTDFITAAFAGVDVLTLSSCISLDERAPEWSWELLIPMWQMIQCRSLYALACYLLDDVWGWEWAVSSVHYLFFLSLGFCQPSSLEQSPRSRFGYGTARGGGGVRSRRWRPLRSCRSPDPVPLRWQEGRGVAGHPWEAGMTCRLFFLLWLLLGPLGGFANGGKVRCHHPVHLLHLASEQV